MSGYHQRFLAAAACGSHHDGLCRRAIEMNCLELVDALPVSSDTGASAFMSETRPITGDIERLAYQLAASPIASGSY